ACVTLAAVVSLSPAQTDLDNAFARFWSAKDPNAAAKAVADVVKAGATFEDVYARLQKGRSYNTNVQTGIVQGRRGGLAGELGYALEIPDSYDPARKYQV